MHGRVKTRTTAEQEEIKKKERAKTVEKYRSGIGLTFEKRIKGEKDKNGLLIAEKLLVGNPDIYTLWNIRREILIHLKSAKSEEEYSELMGYELRLTEVCLRTQPKSYGAWHHRCWVLDHMSNPPWKTELALCNKYLEFDERNFHCWDYRRFVVGRSGISAEEELKFTDEKIAVNFSNYSAWHLRSNLLPQVFPDPEGLKPIEEQQHKLELELVTNAAFTDPYDQSAWFYQRWLLGRQTPQLKIMHVLAKSNMICIAFNQSLDPSSTKVTVKAFGDQPWQTADGEISSYVWKRVFLEVPTIGEISSEPVELLVDGQLEQTVKLLQGSGQAYHYDQPVFQAAFSPGVTEVLCNVLESCQTLLQLEPDTKWPLLTSVLLMQAIDRNKYYDKILEYLELLANIDHLRCNYYFDLRSRYIMEHELERWNVTNDLSLSHHQLTALYHCQYLLPATRLDLRANSLARSLPRLSMLQFCQTLILDENKLTSLQGFPVLPNLVTLSLKKNNIALVENIEPYVKRCAVLLNIHIDDNPLSSNYTFSNGKFVENL